MNETQKTTNIQIIPPERADFEKNFSWKDAPYAFVTNYRMAQMPNHPGRLAWAAETLCCGEEVKGGEYGNDEFCPCCNKPIEWDVDAAKEYKAPFEKAAAEEYNKAFEEYKSRLPENMNALTVGLTQLPADIIIIELAKRIATNNFRFDGKVDSSYIQFYVQKKPPFRTQFLEATVYSSKDNHSYYCTVSFFADKIEVSYSASRQEWFLNREGDWDFDNYTTASKKVTIPYAPEFIKQIILSRDTPERLAVRECDYTRKQLLSQVKATARDILFHRNTSESEALKKSLNSMKELQNLGSTYDMSDFLNEFADDSKKVIRLEKEGSDTTAKICKYKPQLRCSEDGTRGTAYKLEKTIASGITLPELKKYPDTVQNSKASDVDIDKFIPHLSAHLKEIEAVNDTSVVVNEGGYAFYFDWLVENSVYNEKEEAQYGEAKYHLDDGDIWLEAVLDDGEMIVYAEFADGDEEIVKLTPTEKELLISVIGEHLQDISLDAERDDD